MNSLSNSEIPVKYMNSVCRVCLTEQKLLIPLHEINLTHNLNSQGGVENVSINTVFLKYCNVLVHMYDKKPQKICVPCMNAMCQAYNFFELFLQSNALLEEIVQEDELKEREEAFRKTHPKPAKPDTNPFEILPTVLQQVVLDAVKENKPNSNPSCPIAYVETLNVRSIGINDEEESVLLPENNFDSKNDSYMNSKPIKSESEISAKVDGPQNIDSEDKEVASINQKVLKDNVVTNDAIAVSYIKKRRARIKTPPYFINDPTGALRDHNYLMNEKLFIRLKTKRLMRRKPLKPKKEKPVKVNRQELREKQRKYEKENDIFRCKFCMKTYHGIAKVLEHLRDEHRESKRCILCPQIIKTQKSMLYHVASHSKYGLICRICRLYFEDEESLENHKTEFDHTAALTCHICGKTFSQMSKKMIHMEGVHKQNSKFNHQCSHCGLILKWKHNLERHERTHQEMSARKTFLCQICANSFTSKYALELHVKVLHEGQRHLIVKYKKKKYPGKPHKRIIGNPEDQEKKIYECEFCPRKFGLEQAFFKHSISHPEYKPVQCPYCIGIFDNVNSYKHHRALEHSSFVCDVCEKGFPTKLILSAHANTHIKRHKCVMCGIDFGSQQALENHKRVHTGERPYKCDYCDKSFKQQSQLSQHVMCMHTQKHHKCTICEKAFNYQCGLRSHMRTHTGEKPFACLYCDRHFRDTVSRHKHVKRDHADKMEDFMEYKRSFQEKEVREVLFRE